MSKEHLHGLVADVDRLLAAGGTLAPSDEGLWRREKTLRELGKQVPALAQVADKVKRVLEAKPAQASRELLDLLLVARQLRVSLTTVGTDGAMEAVSKSGPWATRTSTCDLYALVEAMSSSGAGRLELMKNALEREVVADIRLADALVGALDDGYGELADLVAEQALPAFGTAIVPDLRRTLDLKGQAADARRLLAICRIDPKAGKELCPQALAAGVFVLRVVALELLSEVDPAAAEQTALDLLVRKPAAAVRKAALKALRGARSDAALEVLLTAVCMSDFEEAAKSLAMLRHRATTDRLIELLNSIVAELVPAWKGKRTMPAPAPGKGEPLPPGYRLVRVLDALADRKDPRVVPALIPLLEIPAKWVRARVAQSLSQTGDAKALAKVSELIHDKGGDCYCKGIHAAFLLPARQRYELLAPLCADLSSKQKASRRKGEWLLDLFHFEAVRRVPARYDLLACDEAPVINPPRTDWDRRWKEALLPHLTGVNGSRVAEALAVVLGPRAVPLLLPLLPNVPKARNWGIARALARLKVREAMPVLIRGLAMKNQEEQYEIVSLLEKLGDRSLIPAIAEVPARVKGYYQHQVQRLIDQLIAHLEKQPEKS